MSLAPSSVPKTHTRDYRRTTFRPRHRAVIRAFAEALFFDAGAPIDGARLDALTEECDRFVSPASKTLRFGLLVALDAIRWLPLFIVGRFALFEDLPTAARVTMLERIERAKVIPIALILVAYKTILAVLFFEDPRELAANGYPGPERLRWRKSLPQASPAAARTEPG